MTIDEAMGDLSIQREVKVMLGKTREAEAIGLGIEALKREKERRKYLVNSIGELLPGETE